jgi:hypothetical protein
MENQRKRILKPVLDFEISCNQNLRILTATYVAENSKSGVTKTKQLVLIAALNGNALIHLPHASNTASMLTSVEE